MQELTRPRIFILSSLLALNLQMALAVSVTHFSGDSSYGTKGFTIKIPEGWKSVSVGQLAPVRSSSSTAIAHELPFARDSAVLEGPEGDDVGITCVYLAHHVPGNDLDLLIPKRLPLHPDYYTAMSFSGWSGGMTIVPMHGNQTWPKALMDIGVAHRDYFIFVHALFSKPPDNATVQTIKNMVQSIQIDGFNKSICKT